MFGSSRKALAAAGKVLNKIQSGKCFYCDKDDKLTRLAMSTTSFPGRNIREIWRIIPSWPTPNAIGVSQTCWAPSNTSTIGWNGTAVTGRLSLVR